MGTIQDGIRNAFGMSYKANFRFHVELGKGMIVSELGLPVHTFDVKGSFKGLSVDSTNDEALILKLAQVRKFKNINLFLAEATNPHVHKAVMELQELYDLKSSFLASLGVQKNANGKRIEAYILRDNAATLDMIPIPINDANWKVQMFRIEMKLPSPELLHGVGEGFNFRKV